jgi:hypothetical protein
LISPQNGFGKAMPLGRASKPYNHGIRIGGVFEFWGFAERGRAVHMDPEALPARLSDPLLTRM